MKNRRKKDVKLIKSKKNFKSSVQIKYFLRIDIIIDIVEQFKT